MNSSPYPAMLARLQRLLPQLRTQARPAATPEDRDHATHSAQRVRSYIRQARQLAEPSRRKDR